MRLFKSFSKQARSRSWLFVCPKNLLARPTRVLQSRGLARLMGHSSPSVAARYYIHVTDTHVAAGFGKFVEYQTRNVAEGIAAAFPQASEAVQ